MTATARSGGSLRTSRRLTLPRLSGVSLFALQATVLLLTCRDRSEVVDEANVYGVLVPNNDGRAGCAAIPTTATVDFDNLAKHVVKRLPNYAQPLFLRIVPA